MRREGLPIKLGRLYQKISPMWSFLDIPFRINRKSSEANVIFLLAPPRSGSTLSYQILSSGINCVYLSNFSNLFFSNPASAFKVARKYSFEKFSNFKSNNGFVGGLWGEAEGLKFWNYWAGCDIIEKDVEHKRDKLIKLKKSIDASTDTFISGFLGHVFSINLLKEIFPNSIFIHLKRDLLSNAYSLYKYKLKTGSRSTLPNGIDFDSTIEKQLLQQILIIHKKIDAAKELGLRCMEISYEDICDSPQYEISRVIDFAKKHNVFIEKSNSFNKIPSQFKISKVEEEENVVTRKLYQEIRILNKLVT